MYYVHLLSYPNGKYDEKVIAAAQKYGYNYAVTGKNGAVDKNWVENHPMEIGRVIIFIGVFKKRGFRQPVFLLIRLADLVKTRYNIINNDFGGMNDEKTYHYRK